MRAYHNERAGDAPLEAFNTSARSDRLPARAVAALPYYQWQQLMWQHI